MIKTNNQKFHFFPLYSQIQKFFLKLYGLSSQKQNSYHQSFSRSWIIEHLLCYPVKHSIFIFFLWSVWKCNGVFLSYFWQFHLPLFRNRKRVPSILFLSCVLSMGCRTLLFEEEFTEFFYIIFFHIIDILRFYIICIVVFSLKNLFLPYFLSRVIPRTLRSILSFTKFWLGKSFWNWATGLIRLVKLSIWIHSFLWVDSLIYFSILCSNSFQVIYSFVVPSIKVIFPALMKEFIIETISFFRITSCCLTCDPCDLFIGFGDCYLGLYLIFWRCWIRFRTIQHFLNF